MPAVKYTKHFNGTTYYVEEEWSKDKISGGQDDV